MLYLHKTLHVFLHLRLQQTQANVYKIKTASPGDDVSSKTRCDDVAELRLV